MRTHWIFRISSFLLTQLFSLRASYDYLCIEDNFLYKLGAWGITLRREFSIAQSGLIVFSDNGSVISSLRNLTFHSQKIVLALHYLPASCNFQIFSYSRSLAVWGSMLTKWLMPWLVTLHVPVFLLSGWRLKTSTSTFGTSTFRRILLTG